MTNTKTVERILMHLRGIWDWNEELCKLLGADEIGRLNEMTEDMNELVLDLLGVPPDTYKDPYAGGDGSGYCRDAAASVLFDWLSDHEPKTIPALLEELKQYTDTV